MNLKSLPIRWMISLLASILMLTLIAPNPVHAQAGIHRAFPAGAVRFTIFNDVLLAGNTPPEIAQIQDTSTDEDRSLEVHCEARDAETAQASLIYSATSSNTTLVPVENILIVYSNLSHTATITPAPNQNGTTTITITVSDGELTASTSFVLTVNPVNDSPTISSIDDLTINEGTNTGEIPFTVGDVETDPSLLDVFVRSSSNTGLAPESSIVLGGSGANRTVKVTPMAGQSGSSTIKIRVGDGSSHVDESFTLTVNARPVISTISNQTINEDSAMPAVSFTIGDTETDASSLTLSASSSNTTLVPPANITLGGSGASRTISITPPANQNGSATITIQVSDGIATSSTSFVLTVTSINDGPTISTIANQTIDENTSTPALPLTLSDVDTAASSLTLSASSSNPNVVPVSNIVFGGSGFNRTVTVTPEKGLNGTATITLTVSDGSLTAFSYFTLTINPVSNIRYASPDGLTTGTCSSWADACALGYSMSMAESGDEVWVKAGVYNKPWGASGQFSLINGVSVFGGFAGTETARIQRNWVTNVTSLDCNNLCIHVVAATGVNNSAVMDGFTITRGKANGTTTETMFGGGFYLVDSSPTLSNLIITNNFARLSGAGMYLKNSSPTMTNIVVSKNTGGGINSDGSPVLTNVTIAANDSTAFGSNGNPQIRNSIIKGYGSGSLGLAVGTGTPVVSYSMIMGGYTGTGNLNVDPQFVDEANGDLRLRGSSFLIDAGNNSVVPLDTLDLDADGNTSEYLPYDAGRNPRFIENPRANTGSGTAPIVDIGAYEAPLNTAPTLDNSGSPALAATDDNLASNNGTLISAILSSGAGGDPISDPDLGAQDGIAITAADTANGAWQFSLDGGNTWTAIGSVSPSSARLLASETNTRLRFVPNANFIGSATITFRAWDLSSSSNGASADTSVNGGNSSYSTVTETASINVVAYSNAPTISNIPDMTINEDASTGDIAFTVGDLDTPLSRLSLSATSSNTTLVPLNNIVFGGSDANRKVNITPVANLSGTSTIKVWVNDGSHSTSDTFVLTVTSVNDAPTISVISDQYINPGTTSSNISFSISDIETPAESLTLSATSSNTALVPIANIIFGGSGTSRTLAITPVANQSGSSTITITVSDGSLSSSSSFSVLTNTRPTIQPIPDQTTEDEVAITVGIYIDDAETEHPYYLTNRATSSNTALVSSFDYFYPSAQEKKLNLTIFPNFNQSGTTTITVTSTDAGNLSTSASFLLTVLSVNDPPVIETNFSDHTIYANTTLGPMGFSVSDNETASDLLQTSVTASNATLTPQSSLVLGGSGSKRNLTITPAANQYGSSTITLSLSDGEYTVSKSFTLTVKASQMYAKPGGSTTSMCNTWEQACELSRAISLANSGDEIWVAEGSHSPGENKTDTFNLKNGVEIYGGFAGTETSRDQRNWKTHISILNGDVGNDAATSNNNMHVVSAVSVNNTAILDGFTIQNGFAAGGGQDNKGGALYIAGTSSSPSNPSIHNLILKDSFGGTGGGALYMYYSTATISNVYAWNNSTALTGGAVLLENSSPNLVNMVIQGSSLYSNGGGMYIDNSSPILTNVTIVNSSSTKAGGGIYLVSGSPQFRNTILWGNTAPSGAQLNCAGGSPTISYSLVQDGCPAGATCDNLVVGNPDPLFVDLTNGNVRLTNTSPAIDAGNNTYMPNDIYDLDGDGITSEPVPFDLDGNTRFFNHPRGDTGNGTPPVLDLGAYEITNATNTAPVLNNTGNPTLTAINEDDTANTGTRIVDILARGAGGDPISDADASSAEGIAITAANSSSGVWEYSLDGTTWTSLGSVSNSSARLLPANATARLRFVPTLNFNGSTNITFRAWDLFTGVSGETANTSTNGGNTAFSSATETASITINPVNDPPTIANIADMTIKMNSATPAITFAVDDIETSPASLTLSGASSNTTLVPVSSIVFGGSGASRTVTVTPAANQSGTATITITVSDGAASAADTFVLTVNATNSAPTISDISDKSTNEDTATTAIAFTVGDAETAAASLTLSAASSNTTLVPAASIVFGGSGANRTVTITPAANQSGTATITVNVSDGTATTSDTFVLTVNAVNDAPTISDITDKSTNEDTATTAIAFTVGDVETAAASLTLSAASSNTSLIPVTNIVFGGSGASRTVTITPAANQSGTATITVNVSDGTATTSDTFVLTVNAVNDVPTISDISDKSTNEDTATAAIAFTVGDVETAAASLTLSAASSNTALIPAANIVFGGSGANRTVTITPAANQSGTATITVNVSDGTATTSDTFVLTVNAVNDAPTISDITDKSTNEDTATTAIAFTVGDVETAAASLTLSAISSNAALIPAANIVFGGSGASRTVTITPAANQSGTATITVNVSDSTATTSDSFVLTVNAVNDAPGISNIPDQSVRLGNPTPHITTTFTVSDIETQPASLVLTATSDNEAIVPPSRISFSGTGADRSMVIDPLDISGTATITVTVKDEGSLTASSSFTLTVQPNNPPAISDITDQSTAEDHATTSIPFTIGDTETDAGSLVLSATSSNPGLVPLTNIVFGGANTDRTVTITPLDNQYGATTITITVMDDTSFTASDSFVLTVDPVNDAPVISKVADQTIDEDTVLGPLAFTITDLESSPDVLLMSAASDNLGLIPVENIVFDGTGSNRTVTLSPAANKSGTAKITLTVSDGSLTANASFTLTVNAINDAPTITSISDQSTLEDTPTQAIDFSIADAESDAGSLTLTALSSNTDLVPDSGISMNGTGPSRTITISPAANQNGSTRITITVSDGSLTSNASFDLTVSPVNDAPVISSISDQTTDEDVPVGAITFTIHDAETDASLLSLNAESSNKTLVPAGNIILGESGDHRTIAINPAANQNGSATITLTVSDGVLTTREDFVLTVNPVNDAPTVSDIIDQTIKEDTATAPLAFSIGDVETGADLLNLLVTSSNLTLLPESGIQVSGSGAERTLTLTPAANQSGTTTITLTASDGTLTGSDSFVLTVDPVNDAPALSDILDQTTDEDVATGPIDFIVSDIESVAADLTVTASSSNLNLVPAENITLGGAGSSARTISITPAINQSGTATITLSVSDGIDTTSNSFLLTVNPVNDAPSLSDTNDQTTDEDTPILALSLTLSDVETPASSLTLSASSSNLSLVPVSGIVFHGTGANRTFDIVPAADQYGSATITIMVSDGIMTSSDSFILTVNPVNDAPIISDTQDQVIDEDKSLDAVTFTVGDIETPVTSLKVSAVSSDTTLVSQENITLGGSGAARTVMVTPAANQSGTTSITLSVSDGEKTASDSFVLTVKPVNDAPTISSLNNQTIDEDTILGPLSLTVGDVETPASSLTLSAASSNSALVPAEGISLDGSGTDRTVTITPSANQNGTTTLTITVSDGEIKSISSFLLTVNAINDPPVNTGLPTISPDTTNKHRLSITSDGTWNDNADGATTLTYAYQWQKAGDDQGTGLIDISGATGTIYNSQEADMNQYVRVQVTAADNGVGTPASSSASAVSAYLLLTNANPVAVTDELSMDEDTVADLQVLANDSDEEDDPLSITGLGSPSHGTATLLGDRVTYKPDPNYNGPDSFSYNLSDGFGGTATGTVNLTIRAVNDVPLISAISDQTTDEDTALGPLTFTVSDVETGSASLILSAVSSNKALVPDDHIALGGSGADRTITITPLADANGETTITLNVSDGSSTTSETFVLTVVPVNDAPSISDTMNQTTDEDTVLGPLPITIVDVEIPAGSLTLSATSSNTALIPLNNITLEGNNSDRTITITPAANQNGTATLTITVSDGELSTSDSFTIAVNPVNDAPTITAIPDQTTEEDTPSQTLAFSIHDIESLETDLTVTAVSSNLSLVPANNILLEGTGAARKVTVYPAADQSGTATVTLTVSDGEKTASSSFILTVTPVNDTPKISDIADQTTNEDAITGPLPFTIGDLESSPASLVLSAVSSNPDLVTAEGIVFGGSGANRTVTISPLPNQNGTVTITITVSDGEKTASDSFVLTVKPVNDAPTLSEIGPQIILEDTSTPVIPFTVNDIDSEVDSLTLTATSSNPDLVPDTQIVFGGSGAHRGVIITPLANQHGKTIISLTVSDGDLSAHNSFELIVESVNDGPVISNIADQTTDEDISTGAINFTISDVESAADDLTVTAGTSNSAFIPAGNITFGGSGANRTVTIVPAANQNGNATITVTVSDGDKTAFDSFILTVHPVNDAPTLSDISNQTTNEDTPTSPIPFTIGDIETPAALLTITATSTNAALIPVLNIEFAGSGANRTISLTPTANQNGSATITVTVSDGEKTASDSFILTVSEVNDPPTISDIADVTTGEDTPTPPISFTVGDIETGAASLILSAASSNTELVPVTGILFGGSGADRTVTLTPAANQSGTATITVTVSDGEQTASDSFVLTVNPVNDAPVISDIPDQTTDEDAVLGSLSLTVGDVETPSGSLTLSAVSSNPDLVQNSNITFGGSGADRTITLIPAANQSGTATITITVSDGELTASDSFVLTVKPVNDAPTISDITNMTTYEDASTSAIPFTVGDVETDAESLTLSATSSDTTLMPVTNIVFGGSGAHRTLTLTPAANQSGKVTITVTVSDGEKTSSDSFVLSVCPVNDTPTISDVADQTTDEDTFLGPLSLTVGDVETPSGLLILSATSSNPELVPVTNIVFGGSDAARTVTLRPAPDQNGTATIMITVSDGEKTASDSFVLTVNPVNDAPEISDIADQTTDEDTSTPAIHFTICDIDTDCELLTLTVTSSNTALVPLDHILLGGVGEHRTVTMTPAANQNGKTTITITVSDGEKTASDSFVLTVNPVNDTPTISDIGDQSILEDTVLGPLSLIVGDVETPPGDLILSAVSSNPDLVPVEAIVLSSSGAERIVTIQPVANQNGTAAITITVSDGEKTASVIFTLTVNPVNDSPTISDIADQIIDEDTILGPLSLTVGDVETPTGSLTLSATSSNTELVPMKNISFSGSGSDRAVTITPLANQNGSTTITLTVSDGQLSTSDSFLLTVEPVNDAPSISNVADQITARDTVLGPLTFTVSDLESHPEDLQVSAASDNVTLMPVENILLSGSGSSRTVTLAPAADQSGKAIITLTVSDGSLTASDSFLLKVTTVNHAPVISAIPDQSTSEDTATSAISFSVADVEDDPASLTVTAVSSNPDLVPTAGILLEGVGSNRTITLTPAANQSGSALITLSVSDGDGTPANTSFTLTVTATNDAPTISEIRDQTTLENTPTAEIVFTVGDIETEVALLTLSATSSNEDLVPLDHIIFGGSKAARSVELTPTESQSGTSTITITVSDGVLTASDSFVLTVSPVNDAPVLSGISDQIIDEDTSTAPLAFTVADLESAAGDLVVTAVSSNTVLVPSDHIVLGGSGTARTITITPASNQNGTAVITITVTDGEKTASDEFILTTRPVNDVPVLAPIGNVRGFTGSLITFTASASDLDGDVLTYSLAPGAPEGTAINAASGVFSWTPTTSGTFDITIRASDNQSSIEENVQIVVTQMGYRPELSFYLPLVLR